MKAPLIVGNWKMHGTQSASFELARAIAKEVRRRPVRAQIAIAPPFTALVPVKQAIRNSAVQLAAQNCHWEVNGAFTGEISPAMLLDLGCELVILGHSERRHIFYENDAVIGQKVRRALEQGLAVILCVGETLNERRARQTARVVARQVRIALKGLSKNVIDKIAIAYEPVWAIGTGQNATTEQISQVHVRIRRFLVSSFGQSIATRVPILYGGSVKPENAEELARAEEIGGFLVGGASLHPESFSPIVRCFDIDRG